MKKKINMFLSTEYEYRRGLAHKLLDEGVIDFCLAAINPYTKLPEKHENIVEINTLPSGDMEYSMICDIDEFPALSEELLEKMLPYESMALKMGVRRSYCREIFEYEDEKRKYLQHVRYWNYILDKYEINMVLSACTPHSQGMYVVYALSKVKNIPFLIVERIGFFDKRRIWGDSIETLGNSVYERYLELTRNKVNDFKLDPDIEEDYLGFMERSKSNSINKALFPSSRKLKKSFKGVYWWKWKEFMYEYIRYNVRAIVKPETVDDLKKREVWFRLRRRHIRSFRYYLKHEIVNKAEYNKMTSDPDYSKKYVCFFLQAYPEASVIPRAGVFVDQYTSIQLLARAAEKLGIYVYVREHPAETTRPKDFYSEIKNIKNVVLIKSESSSNEIIKNSIAIATQTGTCILEAALLGKPVIVFGKGYHMKGCPNLFEMVDEDQGAEVLKNIMKGFSISQEDVLRYIYAMQLESLHEVSVKDEFKRVFNNDYVMPPFPLDDRVKLIREFIKNNITDIGDIS